MIHVSIIGATGYTGVELVRLLGLREDVVLDHLTSRTYAGQKIQHLFPHLLGNVDHTCEELDLEQVTTDSDVIFVALPHGHALPIAKKAKEKGKKVIDLGADFRLKDAAVYEEWYKVPHTEPELLEEAVYGLPEWDRDAIKDATVIANPGCFVTSILLGLMPLMKKGWVVPNSIVCDSKSGTSGAGRAGNVANLFTEVESSFKAYGVAHHRHTPEIEQLLTQMAGTDTMIQFTPHLVPMSRGILSTIYATVTEGHTADEIHALFEETYADEPFVQVLPAGMWPMTKSVKGTNNCQLGVTYDERTGRVIIVSVIDNLMKGAAGQAVQNMNLMFGLAETTGLQMIGLFP